MTDKEHQKGRHGLLKIYKIQDFLRHFLKNDREGSQKERVRQYSLKQYSVCLACAFDL